MRARLTRAQSSVFSDSDAESHEFIKEIEKAGLSVTKEPANYEGFYEYYTEINSLEELNRLVKSFGYPVVYSLCRNGEFEIEKYDDYRE